MKRFKYKPLGADTVKKRASDERKSRDGIFVEGIKIFKIKEPEKNETISHRLRILPPTWEDAEHWGLDTWVRYRIGAGQETGTYLDLQKMKGLPDPISEEQQRCASSDPKYAKSIESTKRVCAWVIDRDNEDAGPQLWPMAWTMDRDICKQQTDKATGDYLDIVDPETGYDVSFDRTGKGERTKYTGVQIARRSSPLSKDDRKMEEWLQFVQDNPIPDQLVFHDYDYLAAVFAGHVPTVEEDDDADKSDKKRNSYESDKSENKSSKEEDVPDFDDITWESVHDMNRTTLEKLGSSVGWDSDDMEAIEDDNELADLICDELKLEKPVKKESDFKKKLAELRAKRNVAA